ncbi:hypothetical protein ES703_31725 [subsurface metagenome]
MEKTLDFQKYQYAGLAASLATSKEGAKYVPGALQVLAGDKGLKLGEEALGFIRGTQASEEGIKTAINVYNKKFQEERGKYKPVDLAKWYGSVLSGLEYTEEAKISIALAKNNETLKDILEKVRKAEYILNYKAQDDLFTSEQRSEAKETMEEYNEVLNIMATLDNYKFEELRSDAVEATRKGSLEDLVKTL